MLSSLKRWFAASPAAAPAAEIEAWARGKGHQYLRVRDGEGFVVESAAGPRRWRLEWGPSQRSYIAGNELRLIHEAGSSRDLQLLVISRAHGEAIEKTVFDQYVEQVQTRIDTATPPEMRWLVMHPKLSAAELKTLREHYIALASQKVWLQHWLAGPMATMLEQAAQATGREQPLVFTIGRARLVMRTAMAQPSLAAIEAWLGHFGVAISETARVVVESQDTGFGGRSTQPATWMPSEHVPPPKR